MIWSGNYGKLAAICWLEYGANIWRFIFMFLNQPEVSPYNLGHGSWFWSWWYYWRLVWLAMDWMASAYLTTQWKNYLGYLCYGWSIRRWFSIMAFSYNELCTSVGDIHYDGLGSSFAWSRVVWIRHYWLLWVICLQLFKYIGKEK